MEHGLHDSILQIQKGNTEELLSIIEKFNPLIQKYKRKLNYEESKTDLIIALIEITKSLNLKNFESRGDGAIVTFINNSMHNKSIDLFRKYILNKKQVIELNFDIIDESNFDNTINQLLITELLNCLTKKQQFIIVQKYFKFHSDIEIGQFLHISRQAVNKSKNEALKVLKAYLNDFEIV